MTKTLRHLGLVAILIAASVCTVNGAIGEWSTLEAKITRLTDDGRSYVRWGQGLSASGRYIAYYRDDSRGFTCEGGRLRQLVVRSEDGEEEYVVTKFGAPYCGAWSPDGKYLAYLFAESWEDQKEMRVYVWSLDTHDATEVGRGFRRAQFHFRSLLSWAPDSGHFLGTIRREPDPDNWSMALWVFAVDGSPALRLAPNHHNSSATEGAPWSPDSEWIAFRSYTSADQVGIWVCRPDGSATRELVRAPAKIFLLDPAWSPDGKWIAYGSAVDRLQDEAWMKDIWVMRPDGSDNHPITHGTKDSTEGRMRFRRYHWAPDSKSLCTEGYRFDALGFEHSGLYLVDAETQALTEIFANSRGSREVITHFEFAHAWAPSGRYIMFAGRKHECHGEPGINQQRTRTRDFIAVYDVAQRETATVREVYPIQDGRRIAFYPWNWAPAWAPDSRRILFTEGRVISLTEEKYEPDLYIAELPEAEPTPAEVEVAPPPEAAVPTALGGAVMIVPQHRRASEIAETLPGTYSGIYQVDRGLNALVVSANDEATLQAFRRDVELLDQALPQIMVDVLVAELSGEASRELGFDWEFTRGRWGALLPLLGGGAAGQVIYSGVGKLDEEFFGTLSALQEKGEATVRANPRVLARCGTQAEITIRKTDNFFYDAGTDYQGKPVRARSDISAEIILKMTPVLLASGKIAMLLDATVETFTFAGANELPDTTRRQAKTDVVCGDGDSIIIGGLTQEEETRVTKKTPLLGDIPILGQFFRHTRRNTRQTTLVMFVTPRVVGDETVEIESVERGLYEPDSESSAGESAYREEGGT